MLNSQMIKLFNKKQNIVRKGEMLVTNIPSFSGSVFFQIFCHYTVLFGKAFIFSDQDTSSVTQYGSIP